MASEHPIGNPNNNNSKSREEGELSSSNGSDADRAFSQYASTTSDAAQVNVNNNTQAEICTSSKLGCSIDVPSRAPQESNPSKSSEKNRGPFVPFLISFSDDDSGSDRDNAGQNTSVRKNRTLAVDKSRKPLAVGPQSQTHQNVTRNQGNPMSRKGPLSRTFVSSMTKISRGTSTNVRPSQNPKAGSNTNVGSGRRTDLHLENGKLQDLRQLITIRENQLKLRTSQKAKEFQKAKELTSASSKDGDCMNTRAFTVRALRETASDNLQSELKEPDNKRKKVVSLNPSKGISDTQENMNLVLASKRGVIRDSDQHNVADHSSWREKIPSCSFTAVQTKQNENQGPVSSTNISLSEKKGIEDIRNPNQSRRKFDLVEIAISSREAVNEAANGLDTVEHPIELSSNCRLPLLRNKVNPRPFGNDLTEKCDDNQVRSVEMAQKPIPDANNVASSIQVAGGNCGANSTSPGLPSIQNCYDKLKISGSSIMDLQSLTDLEELQDKELEEAQEYRRKCEIEERNALKAYRKAQRALLEANSRCSCLYNKREQYSAQLRYLMFENPNLYLSSGTHEETGTSLNPLNSISNVDMHLIPTSSCAAQPQPFNNQQRGNSTIHPDEGTLQNVCNTKIEHQNLATDPFNEPGGSTSEPYKEDYGADGVSSPSKDFSVFPEEDKGAMQYQHKSPENSSEYQGKRNLSFEKGNGPDYEEKAIASVEEENSSKFQGKGKSRVDVDKEKNEKHGPEGPLSLVSSEDSLLLEASLRSQLFERLKMRTLSRMCRSESVEPVAEVRVENGDFFDRVEMSMGSTPFSDTNKENEMLKGDNRSQLTSSAFLYPILRSVFSNVVVADYMNILHTENQNVRTSHYHDEENIGSDATLSISNLDLVEAASVDCFGNMSGSYSCNLVMDPLLPLCMYELRGKCNNDECSLQHLSDYSSGSRMKRNLDSEDKVGSQTQERKSSATRTVTNSLDCLTLAPPTYLVVFDVLKADLHSCKSILSQKYGQQWSRHLSLSFVLSSQLPTDLPSNEPYFDGTDTRIEFHGGWNRQSLYFHSRNGAASGSGKQPHADNDQCVELALICLCQEANKIKGRIQALKVLARALEANPTSAVLWIIYLLLYFSSQKSIGQDDMFRCAVEHNEGSYELWLFYINSRIQLEDRLNAYDAALSALCRHAAASDTNTFCNSEYILDIFLQMMDHLRMSGNIGKAIEKIYGLDLTTKKSDNSLRLFLPVIVTCLTISDKCVFWVCCIYLVIYRKLPDAIVQRFEYKKELSSIDWPSADLTFDEKERGVSLMELAVDSLALYIDRESLEDEANLRAAHLFSVNHVRCVAVIEGLECSRNLLERYVKLYPSCLELVLMLARAEHDFAGGSFEGYEQALDNWLDEVPGVQCIWNQYVQCALYQRKWDFAKDLMTRWFNSYWKMAFSQSETLETVDGGNSRCSLQSASVSDLFGFFSNYSLSDIVFGLLNLSVFKLLQNDHSEAQLAIDRALDAATAWSYSHCVREKLLFMCTADMQDYGPVLKVMCGCLADNRASLASEPLSRQFIQRLEKPRVQQLVVTLLCPVQLDPSLVNSVLEALHGPSLLPQRNDKLLEFIDLVESLMEILPSNYYLAIAVCKQLIRNSNAADVSANVSFWASLLLSDALFQAVPVAPEYFWVEAAGILHDLTDSRTLCSTFLKRALSIYPFSMMLWKIHLNLSKTEGHAESVKEAAGLKGVNLE